MQKATDFYKLYFPYGKISIVCLANSKSNYTE